MNLSIIIILELKSDWNQDNTLMSKDIFHFQHWSSVIFISEVPPSFSTDGGRAIQQVSSEEDNHFASLTDNSSQNLI